MERVTATTSPRGAGSIVVFAATVLVAQTAGASVAQPAGADVIVDLSEDDSDTVLCAVLTPNATALPLLDDGTESERGTWNSEVVLDAEDMQAFLADLQSPGEPHPGLVQLFVDFDDD